MTDVELNENVLDDNEDLTTEDASIKDEVKADILSVEEPGVAEKVVVEEAVITSPEPVEEAPAIVPVADGVIGSGKTKKKSEKPQVAAKEEAVEKVALFADRNITWNGLGKLVKGYNIVPKTAAEQWLTLKTVREATPQEVKARLG